MGKGSRIIAHAPWEANCSTWANSLRQVIFIFLWDFCVYFLARVLSLSQCLLKRDAQMTMFSNITWSTNLKFPFLSPPNPPNQDLWEQILLFFFSFFFFCFSPPSIPGDSFRTTLGPTYLLLPSSLCCPSYKFVCLIG